eukprot:TRINITY_DN359_c5_g1_i1.p1 TRINITY_DN359_c5_g1~~TRINITY_DN359_c5_g1_i1.p1  ORF type:complete len:729 (+),score=279.21 TRINITY_DN359_c5_g1_i1:49-2187(+)
MTENAPGTAFAVGAAVRSCRKITFKTGKVVEQGELGVVTKVPGAQKGSPAQVRIAGLLFSIEEGDVELALNESDFAAIQQQQLQQQQTRQLEQQAIAVSPQGPAAGMLCPDSPTVSDIGTAPQHVEEQSTKERLVPVRHVQYVDNLGHWGDRIQKAKVTRLQRQLQAAAGRLTEEAAAKFEEVAWLQQELERWYNEAESRRLALEKLQSTVKDKDEAVIRAKEALEARDADVAWLRDELQRKNAEANAAHAEVARLDAQVHQKMEDLRGLELVIRKKSNEEVERVKEKDRQQEELRAAHAMVEEQLFAKMEEVARLEQALKSAEERLRFQEAAVNRAQHHSDQQEEEMQRRVGELESQLALAREQARGGVTYADVYCQAETDLADMFARAEVKIAELRTRLGVRDQEVAALEQQLEEAMSQRGGRMESLAAELMEKDARIAVLEAERGAAWRATAVQQTPQRQETGVSGRDVRISQLEQEVDRLRRELRDRPDESQALAAERSAGAMLEEASARERKAVLQIQEMERRLRESERRQWELERLRDALDAKVVAATNALREHHGTAHKKDQRLAEALAAAESEKARADELQQFLTQLRAALPVAHRARLQQELQQLVAPLFSALRDRGGLPAAAASVSSLTGGCDSARVSPPRRGRHDSMHFSSYASAQHPAQVRSASIPSSCDIPELPLASTASSAAWAGRRAVAARVDGPSR